MTGWMNKRPETVITIFPVPYKTHKDSKYDTQYDTGKTTSTDHGCTDQVLIKKTVQSNLD